MKGLIFTFALTYGGAAISLVRPYYGFLVYVAFAILKPDALWGWTLPQGNYSRVVAAGFLIGWGLNGFGNWRFGRGGLIIASMVALWFVIFAGALAAPDSEVAWVPVEPMAKTFLPILAGATLIDSIPKLKQLLWVIVISQGYLAYEFNMTYYDGDFIPWEFTHASLDNNGIAITMVTSVGLAFYLGLHADRWWQQAVAFAAAALMAHVVLFSNSRGGMLSLLVTMAACFILTPKRPRDYLFLLLGVALAFRLAGTGVQERFMTSFDDEGDRGGKRLDHWQACCSSLMKHPFGVGPGHWPLTAPEYGLKFGQAAHSTWLQTAAELGWPGVICLVGIYGTCLVRLWPLMRERTPVSDPWVRYLARMVIASLVGFLVSAQFVTVYGVELPYYVALIGARTLTLVSLNSPAATGGQIWSAPQHMAFERSPSVADATP